MAKPIVYGQLGPYRTECGEYTVGDITNTFAIPTTLQKVWYAQGYATGVAACVSGAARPITYFSSCAGPTIDFSINEVSAGLTISSVAYFAVGY